MSILVTVLDNDERISSDNFEDLLKVSLQRHLSASSFQLLNATVYGKNIIVRSQLLIIPNSLFFSFQMPVHHRMSL